MVRSFFFFISGLQRPNCCVSTHIEERACVLWLLCGGNLCPRHSLRSTVIRTHVNKSRCDISPNDTIKMSQFGAEREQDKKVYKSTGEEVN